MLGGRVPPFLEREGEDYPFVHIRDMLAEADITFGNLEAPFALGGEETKKEYIFYVAPRYAPALTRAGFDILNLANNHIMDLGPPGLNSTQKVLTELGLAFCGAGGNYDEAVKPAFLDVHGLRVAFVGFSMILPRNFWATDSTAGTAYPWVSRLKEVIRKARGESDVVIVSFHWGEELVEIPKEYQREMAHRAVDYGAHLILGHHPHVPQGLEFYRGALIAYSLGNFVFGSYSENVTVGLLLSLTLGQGGVLGGRVIPINVYNREVRFQPRLLIGAERQKALGKIRSLSLELNGGKNILDPEGTLLINSFKN